MAVPPPPTDPYGFATEVLRLAGEAIGDVFGWPDADEETLRNVLAPAWRDLAALATAMGTAAGEQAGKMETSWPDYSGGSFNASVKAFAGGGLGGISDLAAAASQIETSVINYAADVEYTRAQIKWEIAINLPIFVATFATGPAGWAAGALARFLITRGTARVVSGLLEGLATRAAASTFPRAVALTPGRFVRAVGAEIVDELIPTSLALNETGRLNTAFGQEQLEKATLGAGAGEPLSHIIGKPFRGLGNLTSRALDRVGGSRWVQQQGRIFVQSFGTNSISSPLSSKFAEDVHSGNYANLLNVQDAGQYIKDGWLSSGAHGTLRANGVDISRGLSQSASTGLMNRFGTDVSTFTPPPNTPPGELAKVGGEQADVGQAGNGQAGNGQLGNSQGGGGQTGGGQAGSGQAGSLQSGGGQAGGTVTDAGSVTGQDNSGHSDAESELGDQQLAASDQTRSEQGESLLRPPTATAGAHSDAGPVRLGSAQSAYHDTSSTWTENDQPTDPQATDQQTTDQQVVDQRDITADQTVEAQGNEVAESTDGGAANRQGGELHGGEQNSGHQLSGAAPVATGNSAPVVTQAPTSAASSSGPVHSAVGSTAAAASTQPGSAPTTSGKPNVSDDRSAETEVDNTTQEAAQAEELSVDEAASADLELAAADEVVGSASKAEPTVDEEHGFGAGAVLAGAAGHAVASAQPVDEAAKPKRPRTPSKTEVGPVARPNGTDDASTPPHGSRTPPPVDPPRPNPILTPPDGGPTPAMRKVEALDQDQPVLRLGTSEQVTETDVRSVGANRFEVGPDGELIAHLTEVHPQPDERIRASLVDVYRRLMNPDGTIPGWALFKGESLFPADSIVPWRALGRLESTLVAAISGGLQVELTFTTSPDTRLLEATVEIVDPSTGESVLYRRAGIAEQADRVRPHTARAVLQPRWQDPHTPQWPTGPERPVGAPGQPRHEVDPGRYDNGDPDGTYTQELTNRVGDDPLGNVEDWVRHGNPHYASDQWSATHNCGDNARAFADNLQGHPPRLANRDIRTRVDEDGVRVPMTGEMHEMYEFTGIRPDLIDVSHATNPAEYTAGAYDQIRASLEGQPPGTVAIIRGRWAPTPHVTLPGGHWFNAFVDKTGAVRWADMQSGEVGGFPPTYRGRFLDLDVMVRRPGGEWTSPAAPSMKVDLVDGKIELTPNPDSPQSPARSIEPPIVSGNGSAETVPNDGPAPDVEVGVPRTDPDFARAAQEALVAELNAKDDDGRYTPKAVELRERYYRRLATNQRVGKAARKGVASRWGREGVLPEEMTFTASDGASAPVGVPVPFVLQRGNGEVELVDVELGAKLQLVEVPFSDPVLKVTEKIMLGLQRAVDRWLASIGQPQAAPEPTVSQPGAQSGAQLGTMGEQLAEPMVHWLAARHPGEGIRPVHQEQDGAHTFDRIYARIQPETGAILGFVVLEIKNMNADMGQRLGLDGVSRHAQGHPGYVRSTLAAMAAREKNAVVLSGFQAQQLQQALANHTLEYFVVRAQVDRSTGIARPKSLQITEYDMTLGSSAAPAPADPDLYQGSTAPSRSTDNSRQRPDDEGPVRRLGASEQVADRTADVDVGVLSSDPDFVRVAQEAFVAELNAKDDDGRYTPKAVQLRERYYRRLATDQRQGQAGRTEVASRRSRYGLHPEDVTFTATDGVSPSVEVLVPFVSQQGNGEVELVDVELGAKLDMVGVLFSDPVLKVTKKIMRDLQRAVDRWMASLGQPQPSEPDDTRAEAPGTRPAAQLGAFGEQVAEPIAHWLAARHPGEEIRRVDQEQEQEGTPTFDQIYARIQPETGEVLGLVIVEVDNMYADIGHRLGLDGVSRYAQGHPGYVRSTLAAMAAREGSGAALPSGFQTAQLEQALADHTLEYFVVRAQVDRSTGITRPKGLQITEYDLTLGRAPAPVSAVTDLHKASTAPSRSTDNSSQRRDDESPVRRLGASEQVADRTVVRSWGANRVGIGPDGEVTAYLSEVHPQPPPGTRGLLAWALDRMLCPDGTLPGWAFFRDGVAGDIFPADTSVPWGALGRLESSLVDAIRLGNDVKVIFSSNPDTRLLEAIVVVADPSTGESVSYGRAGIAELADRIQQDAARAERPHLKPLQGPNRPSDEPRQPIGAPGQHRHEMEPDRYDNGDPDGSLTQELTERVGDNPLGNVDDWVRYGNPHYKTGHPGATNNCGDNARAFADTLQGHPPRLAYRDLRARVDEKGVRHLDPGELDEMYEYTGVEPDPIDVPDAKTAGEYTAGAYDQIRAALEGQPPGTVAIIAGWWASDNPDTPAAGHWFNAFVDDTGVVRWADMQTGEVGGFPPPYRGSFAMLKVMVRRPGGKWESPAAPSRKVEKVGDQSEFTRNPHSPQQPAPPVGTTRGERVGRLYGSIGGARPDGPLKIGQQVTAVLRAEVPGEAPRFVGSTELEALRAAVDPQALAALEQELTALAESGQGVTLTVTRVARPTPDASPYRFTVEAVDQRATVTTYDALNLADLVDAVRGTPDQVIVAPQSTRLERNIQEAMARTSVANSADVKSIQQTSANTYEIKVTDDVVVQVVVTTGQVEAGQSYTVEIQDGAVPTALVTVAENVRRYDVAPTMAQAVAELGLRLTVGVTDPSLLTREPLLTPTANQDERSDLELTIADRARLANLAQRVADRREMSALRKALTKDAIAKLIESMGLATHQRDADLLRGLIGGRERAMAVAFEPEQSLLDRRLPTAVFVAKVVISSGVNSTAIAAAVLLAGGSPLVAAGMAVPAFVNSLAGAFLDRWLVGKKEVMYRPAYQADDAAREQDYPGFRRLLGIAPAPPNDGPEPPRATQQSHYVVRHVGAAAVGIGAALALVPLGVDPASAITVLAMAAGFRAWAERLVDKGKFNSRLRRVDHMKRKQESDPKSLQNQLLGALADLRRRAERLASMQGLGLDLRAPELGDEPGFPSLGLHGGVQTIDQIPSILRRLLSAGGSEDADPSAAGRPDPRQPQPAANPLAGILEAITSLEGLLGAFGPSLVGGAVGAPVDAWFMRTDEAAGDKRRTYEVTLLAARSAEAILEALGTQLSDIDQLIGQLEADAAQQSGSTPNLADRTQDRADLETGVQLRPPDGPTGAKPFGLTPFWAWLAQVGAVSVAAIGTTLVLDAVLNLEDIPFWLSVAGSIGAVIGVPASRFYFKRAELMRFDRLNHALGAQVSNPAVIDRTAARVQYLLEEIADFAEQVDGATPALSVPLSRSDPDYTDRVRAAVREARTANLPGDDPAVDFRVRQERSWGLQRIESLAAEVDRLVADGRTGPELDEARARLAHAMTVYLRITDNAGIPPFFPLLESVDPVKGEVVRGGYTDRVRAAVDEARRLLRAEPRSEKPLLEERIDALWAIRKAADLVDVRRPLAERGVNHRPLQQAERRLKEAIEKFRALSAEASIPDPLLIALGTDDGPPTSNPPGSNPDNPNPDDLNPDDPNPDNPTPDDPQPDDTNQDHSPEHQNRAELHFGQPGQPDWAALELREVKPVPPTYLEQGQPIRPQRSVPFDWAFGAQAPNVIPPGVNVPGYKVIQLESRLQALIRSGHAVKVVLTKVQGPDGRASLKVRVLLEHADTGRSLLYRDRSIDDMITTLDNHRIRPHTPPDFAGQPDPDSPPDGTTSAADLQLGRVGDAVVLRIGADGVLRGVPPELVVDPQALTALQEKWGELTRAGYVVEVTVTRVARPTPSSDPLRLTVKVTDPASTDPAEASDSYQPATAAELVSLMITEQQSRPGRHRAVESADSPDPDNPDPESAEDGRSEIARALNPVPRPPVEVRQGLDSLGRRTDGGFDGGQVYSSEHQNRAEWSFGQPGQPDQAVLELREETPPPPSWDGYEKARPIPPRRRVPFDWALGHQAARVIPPGVDVPGHLMHRLETLLKAMIAAGHKVTVRLTKVPGPNGRPVLEVSVQLETNDHSTLIRGRSIGDMIAALSAHRIRPDRNPETSARVGVPPGHDASDGGVIRGVARSLMFFSGTRRLMANWEAVEREIHAALARDDVLAAAEIESVTRMPSDPSRPEVLDGNRYLVRPKVGAPFLLNVRAATVDGGHPGEFVVRADGTQPATISVSARSGNTSVARTMANLLHQLAHAGRPSEPSALRPGSNVKRQQAFSREDGGRLAEARLLDKEQETTPRHHPLRRQNIRNEIRALMEHLGVAHSQKDAQYRNALLEGPDGPMVDKQTRGWVKGEERPRLRVYFAKELAFGGLPAVAAAVGIGVVTGSVAAATGVAAPMLAAGAVHAVAQRWLDGHKLRVKWDRLGARLGEVAKRYPGLYSRLEADPFGLVGKPLEDVDPDTMAPGEPRYRIRHLGPAIAGAAVAFALAPTPAAMIAPAIFFGASAVLRPMIERYADGRRLKLKMLRFEELMTRAATDPARYQNQLTDFLEQLDRRLAGATEAIARTGARADGSLDSLDYRTLARVELAEQLPGYGRRLVPGTSDPNELDPTDLAKAISTYGELLLFGAANNLLGALATAGVNTFLEAKNDEAIHDLVTFSVDAMESGESRALFQAMRADLEKALELVGLAEQLAESHQDPATAKLLPRILDRFRGNAETATTSGTPLPTAPDQPELVAGSTPSARMPFWAHILSAAPPLLTLGVVNAVDYYLGLDPAIYHATLLTALAQLIATPIARWAANRQDAQHDVHAADANNELATDQKQLADKLGVLLFLTELTQQAAQARADALRPEPRRITPMNVARSIDILFRSRPSGADFTNHVRAAVRAARTSIVPARGENPRQGFQERQDQHLALDRIEQQADRLDELAEAVRRGDAGARAQLRKARAELVVAVKAHGGLPDLTSVEAADGGRITGDPIVRTRAVVDEAWRRLQAEPGSTPLRVRRVIALSRVRGALDTLDRMLAHAEAGGRKRGVELALNELARTINAFKALQRRAGVAGDTQLNAGPVRKHVQRLLQADGNAARIEGFVADSPVQDHAALAQLIARALQDPGLLGPADVRAIRPIDDGLTVDLTTRSGESLLVRFTAGPVAGGHPAAYRLTGGSEYAVVTVSERISTDDVSRAIVHEIRELTKRTETGAFTPHEQGRMGELLHLAQEVEVEEYASGHDPARRRLYQEKMRALIEELQLDQIRREHLDPAVRAAVEHVEAELAASGQASPYGGPVRLSAEQLYRHIIPLHAYGSPATGTKFHEDFDFDQLEQLAREVVERAPIPVKHDEETGNFAHEYDFGPGVVIGASGTGRVRVWVDPDGNVRTVHPVDGKR